MEKIQNALAGLNVPLFKLGATPITLFSVTQLLIMLVLVSLLSRWTGRLMSDRLLGGTDIDLGTRKAIGAIAHYAVLIIGVVAVMQTFGINLTAFNFLAGALGVGVGFGLQNIFSNFISGLIIMFERPIKVGDRIELGTVQGDVLEIGARRTTIRTNDNVIVIVPNQRFITENVSNLRYRDEALRLRLPFQANASSDPKEVERLVLDIARGHPDVLPEPPPAVRLNAVQPGNLAMELQIWNITRITDRDGLASELNYTINEALAKAGLKPA